MKEISMFNRKRVEAGNSSKGYGRTYFAKREFAKGEEVMRGYGRITDHQTAHKSVQIGINKHYVPMKWTGGYWNHSCDPNTYMRTKPDGFPSLYALKNINRYDEITYHYGMSEFEWSVSADENHVSCRCGAKNCKDRILSFSQLSSRARAYFKEKKYCATYLLHAA